jgi:hypothetical protein
MTTVILHAMLEAAIILVPLSILLWLALHWWRMWP